MKSSADMERIIDDELDIQMRVIGAVLIEGPKGCGKSYTACKRSRSTLNLRDMAPRGMLREASVNNPEMLLDGAYPRSFIEWQYAPELWDAVRHSVDETGGRGQYILTGQSPYFYDVRHEGIGRYCFLKMWPMSLYESGDSDGKISLFGLLDNPDGFRSCLSELSMERLIDCIYRGGWPECVIKPDMSSEYVGKLCDVVLDDVTDICRSRKDRETTRKILKLYAANTGTSSKNIFSEIKGDKEMTQPTLRKYMAALKQLYVVEEIPPWSRNVRDASHIKLSGKHNMADPSLAVYVLGAERSDLNTDYALLCRLFACLCYRDLKVYSQSRDGKIYYYEDRLGLGVDCVLSYDRRKYALIDFCFGHSGLDSCAESLCRLEGLMRANCGLAWYEEGEDTPLTKIILTGTSYGYRRKDGVFVVPVGCLRN